MSKRCAKSRILAVQVSRSALQSRFTEQFFSIRTSRFTDKKKRSITASRNEHPPPPPLVTARDSKMYYTAHKLSEFVGAKGNSLKCVTRRFEPVRGESRGGAGGMEICEFKIESFFVYALI